MAFDNFDFEELESAIAYLEKDLIPQLQQGNESDRAIKLSKMINIGANSIKIGY